MLAGIFGNVAANYLQRSLDRVFGSWNAARSKRALAVNQKFNDDLRLLHHHRHLIQFTIAAENRHRLKGAFESAVAVGLTALTFAEPLYRMGPLSNPALVQMIFFLSVITMTGARAWKNIKATMYHSTLLRVIYENDREALLSELGPATKGEAGPVTLLM